ncbi:lateral signaling target protein 2 homolog isoform X2 [Anabrus simplex]|uniref:lateral signaling target protein 2 homolog isoform X2 n=1 Tax=Anabrus simplex TaxID=316456 RepID=UPI0035A2A7CF
MESIRKWFYKPKRDDTSLLAQFFYADEALNLVASELDSFDGRKDPERCSALVNHLRQCQDKVLTICNRIMDDVIPDERANRDFRVKFPDDVMQENLAGQLWFGAECLAAGSSIMNREGESAAMRPLAKALTKALENVRNLLREQCLRGSAVSNMKSSEVYSERLQEALKIFDRLFAEFELSYVSAMVPVKTPREYELQQLVVVLFSETLQRALHMKLLTQEMVDDYDPALMFTIPRLAIVSGLLIFPDGPLCLDKTPADMSEMFRPFRVLLHKIRELLWTLNKKELYTLEKLLCSSEEVTDYCSSNNSCSLEPHSVNKSLDINSLSSIPASYPTVPDLDDFVTRFYIDYPSCKQFVSDFYSATEVDQWQESTRGDGAVATWENAEESEDETEWVGETSECETVVTELLNGEEIVNNNVVTCSDSEGKTSVFIPGPDNCSHESSSHCISESSSHNDGLVTASFPPSELPPRQYPIIGEPSQFSENIQQIPIVSSLPFPSSSLMASDFSLNEDHSISRDLSPDDQVSEPAIQTDVGSCNSPDRISNASSGFLLANQVGRESMLASLEGPSLRDNHNSGSRESLPDGDSSEAMSVATATLSTLLLSAAVAPGSTSSNQRNDCEEEASIQSPIDSGLGTVVSFSDAGSLSDRSPDGVPNTCLGSSEYKDNESTVIDCSGSTAKCEQGANPLQNNDVVSCVYTLNSRTSSTSVTEEVNTTESKTLISQSNFFCVGERGEVTRLSVNSSPESCEDNTCVKHHQCDFSPTHCSNICDTNSSCSSGVGFKLRNIDHNLNVSESDLITDYYSANNDFQLSSTLAFSNNISSSSKTELRTGEQRLRDGGNDASVIAHSDTVVVPSVIVRTEVEEEWVGVASGEGQCTLCSSNEDRSKRDYANNWDYLRVQASSSRREPSPVKEARKNGALRCRGRKRSKGLSQSPLTKVIPANPNTSCSTSSDTSSFNSDCQDDEEIALAIQAAEIANRNEVRAKFRSSEDLVHRLFVCIAGVADQLQTNFAGDLRNILKCVFLMSATSNGDSSTDSEPELENHPAEQEVVPGENDSGRPVENAEEALGSGWESPPSPVEVESPPPWVPDFMAPRCMACEAIFTVVRRRHHCRNCGKVFCARCSSNSVPLPRYGHVKPVRVCNRCFLYQVTPFTLEEVAATRS